MGVPETIGPWFLASLIMGKSALGCQGVMPADVDASILRDEVHTMKEHIRGLITTLSSGLNFSTSSDNISSQCSEFMYIEHQLSTEPLSI